MTQNDLSQAGVHEPAEAPPGGMDPAASPRRARRDLVPLLYVVGILVLGGALFWLWRNPMSQPRSDAVETTLDEMQARITQLENAPKPAPPDLAPMLAPILARLAALEARPAASAAAPADLSSIEARLAELETHPKLAAPDPALANQVTRLSDRTARAARLQEAAASLAAGRKLGAIADAPEALQRFSDMAPPTEAALRLAFPAAAEAALVASRPAEGDLPAWRRFWNRAQALVSIRQGDEVLVGDPAAGIVARARRELDAGDLAGSLDVLGGLNPAATRAMSGWMSDARAVLAARAALADLAAHS